MILQLLHYFKPILKQTNPTTKIPWIGISIDSIITNNLIPDAELEKDCGNQMQINASFNISEIWMEYLRYH